MEEIRTFNRYNFITGAVDGTLAYDFGSPAMQPAAEPQKHHGRRTNQGEIEWIREDEQVRTRVVAEKRRSLIHPMGVICSIGAIAAVVLLAMILLAQISMIRASEESVALENEIEQLQAENDRLTVEYETVFNLKDVEEYATDVLGMQEARDDQVYYLTNVSSADKAVVVTDTDENMFAMGAQDMITTFRSFLGKLSIGE